MSTLLISLIGSFCWDRLMVAIFAPHIWAVQLEEAKAVTFADFVPILKTVGYIAGGLCLLAMGNPILWGAGYMLYRHFKKAQEATPQAQAAAGRHA